MALEDNAQTRESVKAALKAAGFPEEQLAFQTDYFMSHPDDFIKNNKGFGDILSKYLTSDGKPTGAASGLMHNDPSQGLNGGEPQRDPETGGYNREAILKAFITRMMGPLDLNAPDVQQIIAGARGAAGSDARNRGIGGGLAVSNTENAVSGALNNTSLQRQQLGLQAQGLAQNNEQFAKTFDADQYWKNYSAGAGQYQAGEDRKAGALSTGLGLAGSLIGSYFGMPQLGTAAAQFGAGASYSSGPGYKPPSSFGGYRPPGGGGGGLGGG